MAFVVALILLVHALFANTFQYGSPPVSYVTTPDGILLAYRDYNHDPTHPNQTTIVFTHGAWSNGEIFHKQLGSSDLNTYRMIAWDQRGFGYSDKPTGSTDYTNNKQLGEDVHSIITGIGLSKPILSAWSAGAINVLNYLQAYGDSAISGLHLIDSLSCPDATCVQFGMSSIQSIPSLVTLANPNETAQFAATRQWASTLAYNNSISSRDALIINSIAETVPPFIMAVRYQAPFLVYNTTFANLKVPVLIQFGKDDTLFFYQPEIPGTQSLVKNTTVHSYENAGHIPFILQAKEFNLDLATWLGSFRSSDETG